MPSSYFTVELGPSSSYSPPVTLTTCPVRHLPASALGSRGGGRPVRHPRASRTVISSSHSPPSSRNKSTHSVPSACARRTSPSIPSPLGSPRLTARPTSCRAARSSSLGADHTAIRSPATGSVLGRAFFWGAAAGAAFRLAPLPCSARIRADQARAVTCHEYENI